MQDIPVFDTENGVGSLSLREIPYRGEAYITVGAVSDGVAFLKEAAEFCTAVGAEKVYATGHETVERYPHYSSVLLLVADRESLDHSDAMLFPVTEQTAEKWRSLYNEKFLKVPHAATITAPDMKKLLRSCYFVHRDGQLIGIGKADGDRIGAIAAFVPGAGRDVVLSLAHVLTEGRVTIEVATANPKARSLYERLGFIPVEERIKWYKIK